MTTEEKANELLKKFGAIELGEKPDGTPYFMEDQIEDAKTCALICCDEVLEVIGYPTYFHETRSFWKQVKETLLKP